MTQEHFDMVTECFCRQPIESSKYVLMTVFLVVILVVTFVGNTLVCLVVLLYRRMRTLTNFFIVSLAVSDLLLPLLSLPFRIDQTLHNMVWCQSRSLCQVWLLVDIICSSASIWNLAIISIDRFVAIVMPFRYHTIMTNQRGFICIGFVWIISVAIAPLALLNWTNAEAPHWYWEIPQGQCSKRDPVFYTVTAATHFFLPLAIVVVMYANVFRVACGHARAVNALQQAVTKEQHKSKNSTFVRELKAAKTLAIVVGTFVICWFPFFSIQVVDLWRPELKESMKKETVLGLNYAFYYTLPTLNSTLNPIIYTVFNKSFRSAFKKLFISCLRVAGANIDPTTTERKTTQVSYDLNNCTQCDMHNVIGQPSKTITDQQETETFELSQMNQSFTSEAVMNT